MKSATLALSLAAGLALALAALLAVPSRHAVAQAPSAPTAQPSRVAVVDMLALVERLWETDQYKAPRDEIVRAVQAQAAQIRADMGTLEDKARALHPKEGEPPLTGDALAKANDETAKLQQEYQEKQSALQSLGSQIEQNNLKQIKEGYAALVAACHKKAQELGYSHVIISRTQGDLITATRPADAFQEIVSRTVIVYPDADDITQAVMKELKLDQVKLPTLDLAPPTPDKK